MNLTVNEQEALVKNLAEVWKSGDEALKPSRELRSRIIKAYNCEHEETFIKYANSVNGTKAFLPWVYVAVETAVNRLTNVLLPNDEDTFSLDGETPDDREGCDIMQQYQQSIFDDIDLKSKARNFIKYVVCGFGVAKVFWDKRTVEITERKEVERTEEVLDPVTGMLVPEVIKSLQDVKTRKTIANNFDFELINPDDFILYPIHGELSRATQAHRVWRTKQELLKSQEDDQLYFGVENIPESRSSSNETSNNLRTDQDGLEVKEFWISRLICDGKLYQNMIAVTVDDKYLIRFEPNPYDYGLKPFIYTPLINDMTEHGGVQLTGHGLSQRAYEIQKQANFVMNQMLMEARIKLSGMYKMRTDGILDPNNIVARPNLVLEMEDLNNLEEMKRDLGTLSFGINELQYLQSQFDQATGIPQFYKGVAQFEGDSTATESRLKAEGSDTNFRSYAEQINQNFLKPLIKLAYAFTRQKAIEDVEVLADIARRTQRSKVPAINELGEPVIDPATGQPALVEATPEQLIEMLPDIPAMDSIDVNVVAFETVLNASEKAMATERLISFANNLQAFDPMMKYAVKCDETLKNQARNLRLEADILRTPEEMEAEYNKALMQAQKEVLQEASTQLEVEKQKASLMMAMQGGAPMQNEPA